MPNPTAIDLRAYADQFATLVEAQTGEMLDFTPDSLATLESVISRWRDLDEVYGSPDRPDLALLTAPLAAYLGEVLIRALRGRWVTEEEPDQLLAPYVRLGEHLRVNVLKQAHDVLVGAEPPNFAAYFESVAAQVAAGGPASDVA